MLKSAATLTHSSIETYLLTYLSLALSNLARFLRLFVLLPLALGMSFSAYAGEVKVAVAANFTAPMRVIAQMFEKDTGHKAVLAFGATGQFYAQIKNGAPFDILLAADEKTPHRIADEGLGLKETQLTYATGKLVLWSKDPNLVDDKGQVLKSGNFAKIAIANPKLAPYGVAAMEVLEALELQSALSPRFVEGASIGQTFQFVASGNAPLGFVALSQVFEQGRIKTGSAWIIPSNLHAPIRQDLIVLNSGKGKVATDALLVYMRSDAAKAVIRSFGYDI